ncbi:MAG: Hsp20/alpha crystallin family protein [Gammaproteobacteria bacterium]
MSDKEKKSSKKEIQPSKKDYLLSPHAEMERWFDDFFNRGWMQPFRSGWPGWNEVDFPFKGRTPKMDIIDRETEIVIHAELPGVKKEDLDVSLTENVLTIRASTSHEEKEEKGEFYRREMSRGEFKRTIPLPVNVDAEKAKANFKDGIMELSLPKKEGAKRKSIKVE